MKKFSRSLFLGALFCFSTAAFHVEALLPPVYESVSEFKALITSQELTIQMGSGEMIRDILRDDKGFVVTGLRHTLKVDVVYDPISHPGPAKFHLVFHQPDEIE